MTGIALSLLPVFVLLLLLSGMARAQSAGLEPSPALSPAPAFRYYVWGQVRTPGAYRLSANPDIIELLSAGGGPTEQADLSRVTLIRGVDQRRTTVNLRRALGAGQVITLAPGDVVVVPRSLWYTIRDELTIATTLAIFVNLYFTVANRTAK